VSQVYVCRKVIAVGAARVAELEAEGAGLGRPLRLLSDGLGSFGAVDLLEGRRYVLAPAPAPDVAPGGETMPGGTA
jgi:hypothetical protein